MSGRLGRAQLLLAVGALLVAAGLGLTLWELGADDGSDPPVPVTGEPGRP